MLKLDKDFRILLCSQIKMSRIWLFKTYYFSPNIIEYKQKQTFYINTKPQNLHFVLF